MDQSAQQRVDANIRYIRERLNDIIKNVDYFDNETDVDWGLVGDLAHIQQCLNEALGIEDFDPE